MPAKCFELIPDKLVWVPEQSPGNAGGRWSVDALALCRHGATEWSTAGTYQVYHYSKAACGQAFGPLGLESLLRFCRGLAAKLEGLKSGGGVLTVTSPAGDKEHRANAAVLLGAYLVLRHDWSAASLAAFLGQEDAGAKFACSWERRGRPAAGRVMQVRDCWAGIELAKREGWIDTGIIRDGAKADAACAEYDELLTFYDTTWIIPGMLMVGADPMSVAFDPNPATCSQVFPREDDKGNSSCSTASVPSEDDDDVESTCSLDTVCKEYTTDFAHSPAKRGDTGTDMKQEGRDFTSFLRQSGVGIIVRANFDGERGMPVRVGYSDHAFEAHGIAQANIRMADKRGSLPRSSDVARMLEVCEGFMERRGKNAVMVHCKGGFGRSVVLACCLAISRLDVPGAALLGWVRVARPGAVTTREQELFLASLKGRKDVLRYAKVSTVDGVAFQCSNPCQIQ